MVSLAQAETHARQRSTDHIPPSYIYTHYTPKKVIITNTFTCFSLVLMWCSCELEQPVLRRSSSSSSSARASVRCSWTSEDGAHKCHRGGCAVATTPTFQDAEDGCVVGGGLAPARRAPNVPQGRPTLLSWHGCRWCASVAAVAGWQ